MKKKSKNFFKNKDLTSVYIAVLALVVIVVIFFLAYLSKMGKTPAKQVEVPSTTGEPVMNGQQTATITILPAGSQAGVAGVTASSSQPAGATASSTQQNGVQSHITMSENSGSVPAGSRVKFKIDHFKKLALQPLEFEVFDEQGKAYSSADLRVTKEQRMHFIVVSANLREYMHLHPKYENGKWKVLANLPNPGTYYAYVDITPVKGDPVVLRSNLIVQKETTDTINYPGLTPDLFALTKGYKTQLTISQPIVLQQSVLSFRVTKDGKDSELSPYLGALGHVVVFRQGNIDSFTHVHPLSSSDAKKGLAEFMNTFVKGGRYTAFAEFKIGSTVYTFPITFDING